eukprot:c15161_g1_i2.p1 GENE.c15161_g1_i2~~c15161_g1_i2.p1  ORF type:complete len:586 (+),score=125.04 c15161_g1_i2:252-1760(+)
MFALKILDNGIVDEYYHHVEAEICTMSVLDHPHIVRLHEVVHTPESVVLVMDLVKGGELFDKIVTMRKFSERVVKAICAQLLEALQEIHAHDIMHRDLKPENILIDQVDINVTEEVTIKVTDFGLAAFVHKEMFKGCLGTVEYSAPELVEGTRVQGTSADMWSLGVILYVLLSGISPFQGSPAAIAQAVKTGKYSFSHFVWTTVSDDVKDLIKRLLVVNQAERLTVKQARAHPWLADAWLPDGQVAPSTARQDKPSLLGDVQMDSVLAASTNNLLVYNAFKKFRNAVFMGLAVKRMQDIEAEIEARQSRQSSVMETPPDANDPQSSSRSVSSKIPMPRARRLSIHNPIIVGSPFHPRRAVEGQGSPTRDSGDDEPDTTIVITKQPSPKQHRPSPKHQRSPKQRQPSPSSKQRQPSPSSKLRSSSNQPSPKRQPSPGPKHQPSPTRKHQTSPTPSHQPASAPNSNETRRRGSDAQTKRKGLFGSRQSTSGRKDSRKSLTRSAK